MQIIIVFAALVAVTLSVGIGNSRSATILRSNSETGADGYRYSFETSDGIKKQETGELKNINTDAEALTARGSFSYVYDGRTYTVNYVADENGFRAEGDHLPSNSYNA